MNSMKRKVIAAAACMSLLTVGFAGIANGAVAETAPADTAVEANAIAEEGDLGENAGVETITLDNGISFTYNANNFSVYVNPDNSVVGEYLGDLKAGFTIGRIEGVDAQSFMSEMAEEYGVELNYDACFASGDEWFFINSTGEEDGVESIDTTYAHDVGNDAVVVSVFVFPGSDEAAAMEFSDSMSAILDTLTIAE